MRRNGRQSTSTDLERRQQVVADEILAALSKISLPTTPVIGETGMKHFESLPVLKCSATDNTNAVSPNIEVRPESLRKEWQRCTSMNNSYGEEWKRLFLHTTADDVSHRHHHRQLHDVGLKGGLRNCRFRSVVWRLFLGVLPDQVQNWVHATQSWREKYDNYRSRFLIDPHGSCTGDVDLDNPLSLDKRSFWNQYFQRTELRVLILQDVQRTFPEIQFFHSDEIKSIMVNVLFCYSCLHPISYRQGMHEILAPLIFVIHSDHLAFQHACEQDILSETLREQADQLLDSKYIEHDSFAMFSQIMEVIRDWYVTDEPDSSSRSSASASPLEQQPFQRPQDQSAYLAAHEVVHKLSRIHDQLLKKLDPELHLHLERLEIAPQVYGIRWVRLLFGREFPLQDLLVVWDAIFSDGFDLVEPLFVAMLLNVRELLLAADFAGSLTLLMRYPSGADVVHLVEMALHLRDPQRFARPATPAYQENFLRKYQVQASRNAARGFGGFVGAPGTLLNHYEDEKVSARRNIARRATTAFDNHNGSAWHNTMQRLRRFGSRENLTLIAQQPSSLSLVNSDAGVAFQSTASSHVHTPSFLRTVSAVPALHCPTELPPKELRELGISTSRYDDVDEMSLRNDHELYKTHQLSHYQDMCEFCGKVVAVNLQSLKEHWLNSESSQQSETVMMAFAELKQVCDMLRRKLPFDKELFAKSMLEDYDNKPSFFVGNDDRCNQF